VPADRILGVGNGGPRGHLRMMFDFYSDDFIRKSVASYAAMAAMGALVMVGRKNTATLCVTRYAESQSAYGTPLLSAVRRGCRRRNETPVKIMRGNSICI